MGNFKEFITVFINRPLDLIMEDIDTEGDPLYGMAKKKDLLIYIEIGLIYIKSIVI